MMNKQTNNESFAPQLRFPEFRDSEAWKKQQIQDLIDEKIIIDHLDGNHGTLYPRAEEFSKEGIPYISADDFISGYVDFGRCKYLPLSRARLFKKGVAKDGDILFAHNGTVGTIAKLNTSFKFVVLSTTATYFRCDNKFLLNDFVKYAFASPAFIRQYVRVMFQSTRNQIPITAQRKFYLQLPFPSEQQKIANCLSSLDKLIALQTEKLDHFKAHKKGLMQQLFPVSVGFVQPTDISHFGSRVEGNTPKLCFPEFRDMGWSEDSIASLVKEGILLAPKDGNHGEMHPKSSDFVEMGIPFVMANDIQNGEIDYSECTYIKKERADSLKKGFAQEGDVLLTHKGTVGEVALVSDIEFPYLMLTPQVTYYRIKDEEKLSNKFLATLFISEYFQRPLKVIADSGPRPYIGIIKQGKLKVTMPKNILEQQKIADTISSLDNLITIQAKKINTLKTHKKGLMQQLFPFDNE
jgi:restriction endonuclease S subunit